MTLTEDPNWDRSKGYAPGSFGIGPEYDKYTKLFQNHIDEGTTMEQGMYLSRTSTPEDFLRAFGDKSMWKKWGGGSKGGSRGSRSSSGGHPGGTGSTRGSTRSSTGGSS